MVETFNYHASEGQAERIDRLLRAFEKILHHFKPASNCGGVIDELHITQRVSLKLIHVSPGITQSDIASKIGVTTAAISPAVREMVERGLVERQPAPDDGRSMQLFLTSEGNQAVAAMEQHRRASIAPIVNRLSDADLDTLVALLERLTQSV